MNAARIKSRDARRIADVAQLRLALELYFDVHGKYPLALVELPPDFMPVLPLDPVDGSSYIYSAHGSQQDYHLGANLEESTSAVLKNDADCNSVAGIDCGRAGGYGWSTAFDGADTKGCRGEIDRFCYDVTP